MKNSIRSNFDMLLAYEKQLWRLGALAERYFAEDPNTSLLKLRQFSELLAQSLAARTGLYSNPEESQYELIRRLQGEGVLPKEVKQVLDQIRVMGNAANHALQGDHAAALSTLKLCWQLSLWFHRTFKDTAYRSGPFVPPQEPDDESSGLRAELSELRQAVAAFQSQQEEVSKELQSTKTQLSSLSEERGVWEQLATEADNDKARLAEQLAALQAAAETAPTTQFKYFLQSAATAATQVQLDEVETRRIIDEQLRQAGWEANTQALRYSKGNFRLAGVLCNTANKEYSEDTVGKSDWFPLADPTKRACLTARDCSVESPVLLDPADPDDPCKLIFNDDGTVQADPDLPADIQTDVSAAIQYLGLTQGMLNGARKGTWRRCSRNIAQYNRIAKKRKGDRTQEEAATLTELREELMGMTRASSEFAAVARCCLRINKLDQFIIADELIPIADVE